jgi:hypothetical protein
MDLFGTEHGYFKKRATGMGWCVDMMTTDFKNIRGTQVESS